MVYPLKDETIRCFCNGGYVMSGGQHGMAQQCSCCRARAWHKPDDGSMCAERAAA